MQKEEERHKNVGIKLTGNVTISLVVAVPVLRMPSALSEYKIPNTMADTKISVTSLSARNPFQVLKR